MSITMLAIIWACIITVVIIAKVKGSKKNDGNLNITSNKNKRNNLYFAYALFTKTPIINKEFAKVKAQVRLLYPADEMSINTEATRIMLKNVRNSLLIILLGAIFCNGDLYFLIFCIFMAFTMFAGSVNSQLYKANRTLLNQFSDFMSNLISVYREKHGHLDDAIFSMLDSLPQFVGLHVSKIYEIIKSPHPEEASAAYTDYAPNNVILSFVSLATTTRIYCDKTLPDGNTTFIKGLTNLQKQLNEEVLNMDRLDIAFSSLSTISLVAVLAMKPLQLFFTMFLPPTKSFFDGPFGVAAMTILFIASYVCYNLVLSLKNSRKHDVKESSIFSKIAARPGISEMLNAQYRKHYTKMTNIEKQMRAVGDHTGAKAHMVQCALVSIGAFVLVNMLFITGTISSANNTLTNYEDEFSNVVTPSDKYTQSMKDMTKILVDEHKNDPMPTDEQSKQEMEQQLAKEIRAKSENIKSDQYVIPIADAVIEKSTDYQGNYFHFWYEFIAIAAAIGCFFVPTWILKFKSDAMKMSKEDEVNSFNLLAMIFMDMDGIQVETLLEWMERFSYYYQDPIVECITMMPMGRQKALEHLMEYDDMQEFKKFVRCMMNVDEVGFKKAFSDIEIQQNYYNDKRKVDNEKLIMKKRTKAERIAFTPMYLEIAIWIILPIVAYAVNMTKSFMTSINSL